jgi:Ran GTPase-activating protein (RanGAP) involved in mRNA processing and transport
MHEREAKKPKTGGRSGGPLDLAAQPRFAAKPRRLQRLQLRVTGYNTGDCFVVAVLTHIAPSKPTTRNIVDLRTEASLPARGATDGAHMVQLLSHLSYGCVIVNESHSRATILNAAGASSCYVTVARKGSAHVEPVALSGTVQVRTLDEIIGLLRVCGVQVQLPVPRPESDLADVISLSDNEGARNRATQDSSEMCGLHAGFVEAQCGIPSSFEKMTFNNEREQLNVYMLERLFKMVETFDSLLLVVVAFQNSIQDFDLTTSELGGLRDSMSGYKLFSMQKVYTELYARTTGPKESDVEFASIARVMDALRTSLNSKVKTKQVNCHAIAVATIIIHLHNHPGEAPHIQVVASCEHLQIWYKGVVLRAPGEKPLSQGHFSQISQYPLTPRQLALSLIPAMTPMGVSNTIRECHRCLLEEHSASLCPWLLLDLARYPGTTREQSEVLYAKAVNMVRGHPTILGPELTYYLDTTAIGTAHGYLIRKLKLLAHSEFNGITVDTHTANMIRDVRALLGGGSSCDAQYLVQLDEALASISVPAHLSMQLSVVKPRRGNATKTKVESKGCRRVGVKRPLAAAHCGLLAEMAKPVRDRPRVTRSSSNGTQANPIELDDSDDDDGSGSGSGSGSGLGSAQAQGTRHMARTKQTARKSRHAGNPIPARHKQRPGWDISHDLLIIVLKFCDAPYLAREALTCSLWHSAVEKLPRQLKSMGLEQVAMMRFVGSMLMGGSGATLAEVIKSIRHPDLRRESKAIIPYFQLEHEFNSIGALVSVLASRCCPALNLDSRQQRSVVNFDSDGNAYDGHHFGDEGATALAAVLAPTSITALKLTSNSIGAEGAKALAAALVGSSITVLNLEENPIGVGDDGAKALEALLSISSITSLDLSDNCIGGGGAAAMAAVLPKSSITTLHLCSNSIDVEGVTALAEVLSSTSVTFLDLDGNCVGNEGVVALAEALEGSHTTTLRLGSNSIGAGGARALAAVLPSTSITVLVLSDNSIGAGGVTALAAVLPSTSITGLDLGSNFIDVEGVTALAEVLSSTSITTLNLDDNSIGDEGVTALAGVAKGSHVTNLNLSNNSIGDIGATALSEVLADSCIAWLDLDYNFTVVNPNPNPNGMYDFISHMGVAALAEVVVKTPRFSCAMPEFCSKLWPDGDGRNMFKIWCDQPNRYCDEVAVFAHGDSRSERVPILGCDDTLIMIMEGEMAGFANFAHTNGTNFAHEPLTSSGWHISVQALAAATKAREESEAHDHQLNKRNGYECGRGCGPCASAGVAELRH